MPPSAFALFTVFIGSADAPWAATIRMFAYGPDGSVYQGIRFIDGKTERN
jgi:hypothetical protein